MADVAIREDVHIHVPLASVHRALADPTDHDAWLAPAAQQFTADSEGCAFMLALPGHTDRVRLRRDGTESRAVTYLGESASSVTSLVWALHAEGPQEVHLTAEMTYRPAGGPMGAAADRLIHRQNRIQFLRDSLWRLKRHLEASYERQPVSMRLY